MGHHPRVTSTAYGDESEPDERLAPGTYVLALALIDDAVAEECREVMRAAKLPAQRKLHFHSEGQRRRRELVARVAELEAVHLVAVRAAVAEHSERRRRMCLKAVLLELEHKFGVDQVALEARERKQNERDLGLLAQLRSGRAIGSALRMYHPRGPGEPLLWVADVVAGAVTAHLQGEPEYFETLAGRITLYDVTD